MHTETIAFSQRFSYEQLLSGLEQLGALNQPFSTKMVALYFGVSVYKARNARATGAVEKARDIIECDFEAGLRFVRIETLEQLKHYARLWRMDFNLNRIHSRHKMTRTTAWKTITAEQLVKAPPPGGCRELAIAALVERVVNSKLRVSFRGQQFSVENVPHACVGDNIVKSKIFY